MSQSNLLLLATAVVLFIAPCALASIFTRVEYDVNLTLISENITITERATTGAGSTNQATFNENFQASEPVTGTSLSVDFNSQLEASQLSVTASAAIMATPLSGPLENLNVQGFAQYFFTLDNPAEIELIAEIRSLDPGASSLSQPGSAWSRLQIRQLGDNAFTVYSSPDRTDGQSVFINEQLDLPAGDYLYQVDLFGTRALPDGPELYSESILNIIPEPGLSGFLIIFTLSAYRRRR